MYTGNDIHPAALEYLRVLRGLFTGAYGSPAEDYKADVERAEQAWREIGCPIRVRDEKPAPPRLS
jgi:hypothetical protein